MQLLLKSALTVELVEVSEDHFTECGRKTVQQLKRAG